MKNFDSFPLSKEIQKALKVLGFEKPTNIQAKALPTLLSADRVDFHGQAQTGTGKTLAFGLPLLQKIDEKSSDTQALIIAPTRELVTQISESLSQVSQFLRVSILPIYGGVSITKQAQSLKKRQAQIIVGTPGRLIDHLKRKTLQLDSLRVLVLDEADIMLDMGFKEDIDFVLSRAPHDRQIWLFSATTKVGVDSIKKSHMKNVVSVRSTSQNVPSSNTEQFFCIVQMKYRLQALCRMIDKAVDFYGVVFCQTKLLTGEIAEKLRKLGYNVAALHGDMDQTLRNKVIKKFKEKSFDILVATDVAARGIDVANLTHVINYSLPDDKESYIHRIGRTGRAGKQGTAITFVNRSETKTVKFLSRKFNVEILPLEIPTVSDVIAVRTAKAIEFFNESRQVKEDGRALGQLKSSMQDLSKDQLIDGVVGLLSDKFLKAYEKEKEIPSASCDDFDNKSSRFKRDDRFNKDDRFSKNDKYSELVIHAGMDDGITGKDIVHYLLSSQVIKKDQVGKVRVIKRRSFVIVSSAISHSLMNALRKKKLQNRKVRIGITSR